MKRALILIILVSLSTLVSAQEGFQECIKNILTNPDSIKSFENFTEGWKKCVLEKPVPDISFQTISGNKVETKSLRGKVVVLNFWYMTCAPCISELQALNKLVREYKNKDVMFFGITYETVKTLKSEFFSNYKFDFTIVPDAKTITEMFAAGYPTTYIIDKNGIIKDVWNGGATDNTAETAAYWKAKPVIDELLNEK
jgi:peroxiredoxin